MSKPLLPRIIAYYDETWVDYRTLWLNPGNLAVHFGYYDETTASHEQALLRMNEVMAERAAIQPGERVLDAGCGVGGSSLWLAEKRAAEVVGANVVPSQIARARENARKRGLSDRVTFEQCDYTQTPFPDASFDVIWALESMCHAPDKSAFYREAARLLRPGGRLIVAEYLRSGRPLDERGERLIHQWLDGWAIPDIDTADEHRSHAAAAGLARVLVDDITAHTRPSLRRLYNMTAWTYPLAIIGRIVRIRTAAQHGNVVGSLRQYQALEGRYWFYGMISARKE